MTKEIDDQLHEESHAASEEQAELDDVEFLQTIGLVPMSGNRVQNLSERIRKQKFNQRPIVPFYVDIGPMQPDPNIGAVTYQPEKPPERIHRLLLWNSAGVIHDIRAANVTQFAKVGAIEARVFFECAQYTYEQVKAAIDRGYMPAFRGLSFDLPTLTDVTQALALVHCASWSNALWIGTRFA